MSKIETYLPYSSAFSCLSNDYGGALPFKRKVRIFFVDHEDSFVHTLANYFEQTGANVFMVRPPIKESELDAFRPNLVVLSPGPGTPSDFNCDRTIGLCLSRNLPIFGICLGLQAIAEFYGAKLRRLPSPVHGKTSLTTVLYPGTLFKDLPEKITVGRYHSLFIDDLNFPDTLCITARAEDGVIMAIEHRNASLMAVQFHPESIMMEEKNIGMRIIQNIVTYLAKPVY